MSDANSSIYNPDPLNGIPGPILRPNPDPYEYRVSPVSDGGRNGRGRDRDSGFSGGYSGGFPGRATGDRIRPVVDPYRIPYEGT